MIKLKLIVVSRLIVVYAIRRKCLHLAGLFFLHFARFNPYRPGSFLWDMGNHCRPRSDAAERYCLLT